MRLIHFSYFLTLIPLIINTSTYIWQTLSYFLSEAVVERDASSKLDAIVVEFFYGQL